MNFKNSVLVALLACVSFSNARLTADVETMEEGERDLGFKGKRRLTLKVTNISYRQIFSPFFYMTHSCDVSLYELGEEASPAIEQLAEDGASTLLLETYPSSRRDVCMSGVASGPVLPGMSTDISVTTSRRCPCVSIASMAIVTNDCFVAVNGERLYRGADNFYPGLDAGTETNTELCTDIPGCGDPNTNANPSGGEGFVHIHRGIEQRADLNGTEQWLNPMMRVQVL